MDNEAARRAKISESNKKRQQNALPVWHQQSTISAPLKGTGDRANAVEESDSDEEDQFEAVDNEEYDQDRADCKNLGLWCGLPGFFTLTHNRYQIMQNTMTLSMSLLQTQSR